VIDCALLGSVQVTMDGGPAPRALQWKKHLALLAYLACAPRRTRSRQHLIGLLWGDRDEARARHSLNEAARVLRRALGEDAVIGTGVSSR
jgi:DNA-binding SARP family transcriptional activator